MLSYFKNWHLPYVLLLCCFVALPQSFVFAQDEAEELVVIGTRAQPRSVLDSTVPIDVITGENLRTQGSGDMNFMLRSVVPSFHVNMQPGRDTAALQNPINLRGLAPDHTLVLLNGKRRHRGATITWISDGRSDGAQGPDISVIPAIALRRVEVLRDGAAAQYGSDAIAGVINFELRDDNEGATLEYRHGWFTEDGSEEKSRVSGNAGVPLGDTGFGNFSFEYSSDDPTSRSDTRNDVAAMIEGGNTYIANPAHVWGSPDIDGNFKSVFNMGFDMDGDQRMYAFGNFSKREVDTGFFYREPEDEAEVFATLIDDPDSANPEDQIRVPLVYMVGDADCSQYRVPMAPSGLPTNLDDLRADANCFTYHEWFPGGFQPRFSGEVTDYSAVGGTEGTMINGIGYDFSVSYGKNEAEYYIANTINPSWGPNSPTSFYLGAYIQTETNVNLDLSYEADVGLAALMSIAGGFEWRKEEFEIEQGDRASWEPGIYKDQSGKNGSNGFGGFGPTASGKWSRDNIAVYLDLEADVTPDWTVSSAIRWEDFDEFGTTTEAKVTTRYQMTDALAMRAGIGSGFRAPTPGQQNAYNISTVFDPMTVEPVESGTVPSDSALATLFGGRVLEPEESDNYTLGAIFTQGDLSITVDYFRIEVDDRIFLSEGIDLEQAVREDTTGTLAARIAAAEEADGLSANFSEIRFFENDFDSETDGIDVVVTYDHSWNYGDTEFMLSYNRTETEIKSYSNLSERRKLWIEQGVPETRVVATVNHTFGNCDYMVRYNHYGDWYSDYDSRDNDSRYYGDQGLVDVSMSKRFGGFSVIVGSDNVFDSHPDRSSGAASRGNRYPRFAPAGINGRFVYARFMYEF